MSIRKLSATELTEAESSWIRADLSEETKNQLSMIDRVLESVETVKASAVPAGGFICKKCNEFCVEDSFYCADHRAVEDIPYFSKPLYQERKTESLAGVRF